MERAAGMEEMQRKVKQQPQKFPDYLEEDGKLPHRAGNEDVASCKMCVPIGQRQCVMTENYDIQLRDTWEVARRLPGLQLVFIGRECIET